MIDFEKKNHYELLGLERDASMEQIKQAFKEIAVVYHPDSNFFDEILEEVELPPDDMKLFKAITQAYNVLSNEEKRREYDKELSRSALSHDINLTGEWVKPDGSTPQNERKARERAPTITNLQKLQKQYEETVNSQVKLKVQEVPPVEDLLKSRDSKGAKINALLIFLLIFATILVFVAILMFL